MVLSDLELSKLFLVLMSTSGPDDQAQDHKMPQPGQTPASKNWKPRLSSMSQKLSSILSRQIVISQPPELLEISIKHQYVPYLV